MKGCVAAAQPVGDDQAILAPELREGERVAVVSGFDNDCLDI